MELAVVIGGARGVLAPLEFGVSEKKTEIEIDSLLISAPSDLRLTTAHGHNLIHTTFVRCQQRR